MNIADAVVVGGGSAGSVIAQRLSVAGWQTALLERGPRLAGADTASLTRLRLDSQAPRVHNYRTTDGMTLPRGTGLGGSSVINAGYFLRWHREDFMSWPWSIEEMLVLYARVGGVTGGGGIMSVSEVSNDELSTVATVVEKSAAAMGLPTVSGDWTGPGVNRLRMNRRGAARVSVVDAYLRDTKIDIRVGWTVRAIERDRGRGWSVHTDAGVIRARHVVLAAGTFGTAEILLRSGLVREPLPFAEHRERLVRYRPAVPLVDENALLHTVIHTQYGVELRPYNGEFARYIDGVAADVPAVGVALMRPEHRGALRLTRDRLVIDMGLPTDADRMRLREGEQLATALLADLARPGSVHRESTLGTSQHAGGSLPLGTATDAGGGLEDGVTVADASVLASPGSAGPHHTVIAVAEGIADRLLGVRSR